jgi:DNA-binding NtrC family response regulator
VVVLVVDDDPSVGRALVRDLAALGRQAVCVTTPLDAIKYLQSSLSRVEVALVDYDLNTADGLDLLDFLNKEYPAVRRVLMSGCVGLELLDQACESGQAHTAFAKPWDRERLSQVLAQVLAGI